MRQMQIADEIICYFETISQVKGCTLYGSLANRNADTYSDIDICVDVSGCDNGAFMLTLPELLRKRFNVLWYDFAPSLAPEQYVISVATDEENPFCVADFNCFAEPHITTVQKGDLENEVYTHLLKLWIANCKHYIRGEGYSGDIHKMGRKCIGADAEELTDEVIIEEVLRRLQINAPDRLKTYVSNCRKAWDNR